MQVPELTSDIINQLESIISNLQSDGVQVSPVELEYRAYYGADGSIITYTTEKIPGEYVVITREQWAEARPDAKVVDGKLVYTHIQRHVFKLEMAAGGKYRSSEWDVNILAEENTDVDTVTWDIKAYDIRR